MADHKIHTDPAGNWTGTDPAGSTVDFVRSGTGHPGPRNRMTGNRLQGRCVSAGCFMQYR